MRKITTRTKQPYDLKDMIGEVLTSNLFSTFKGKLLYIKNERCYFEIVENPECPKYNSSAGKIEYLPEEIVTTMNFKL
jgi:hypothetical protein